MQFLHSSYNQRALNGYNPWVVLPKDNLAMFSVDQLNSINISGWQCYVLENSFWKSSRWNAWTREAAMLSTDKIPCTKHRDDAFLTTSKPSKTKSKKSSHLQRKGLCGCYVCFQVLHIYLNYCFLADVAHVLKTQHLTLEWNCQNDRNREWRKCYVTTF